jgi:hypothetical protein
MGGKVHCDEIAGWCTERRKSGIAHRIRITVAQTARSSASVGLANSGYGAPELVEVDFDSQIAVPESAIAMLIKARSRENCSTFELVPFKSAIVTAI